MVERGGIGRFVLFVAVSAVLVVAAIALSGSSDPASAPPIPQAQGGVPPSVREAIAELERRRAAAKVASRRFLRAFFRYEVGDITPWVRRTLRASATAGFARRLLRSPPRRPTSGRFPPRAEPGKLDVSLVAARAMRAVISGTAQRGGLPEEFSFVFAYRGGRWLASGAAE